jgi:dimethylaniline monooxygenase (N-oxide forming)
MPYLNRHWTGERNWFLNAIGNRYSILTSQRTLSRNWVDTFHKGIDETGRVISEARKGRKDWRRMQEKEVKPNCIIYYTGLVSTFLYQNTTNILKSYKQTFSYLHPPFPTSNDANIRNIVSPTHLTIAYIGFERPGVGATPPLPNRRTASNVVVIPHSLPYVPSNLSTMPPSPPARPSSRIQYGVDYSAYMST